MTGRIAFFGDPHGDFSVFHHAVANERPDVAIFLGDLGLERPLEEEVADFLTQGDDVWWIFGNHDTDHANWYDRLFASKMADKNLSGRVVDFDGVRVAGLGGVFRKKVWFPKEGNEKPAFETRAEFNTVNRHHRWRSHLPLRHRSTIFPEDFEVLSKSRADILVTHEAPSNHQHGFMAIDQLAEQMGVRMIVHGHHHKAYEDTSSSGISVVGVQKAGMYQYPALGRTFAP